jgi:hypothetical protein
MMTSGRHSACVLASPFGEGPGHAPVQVRSTAVQSTAQWGGRTPKAGGRLLDGRTWDQMPAAAGGAGGDGDG